MHAALLSCLVLSLSYLAYEDNKYRAISPYVLVILAALSFSYSIRSIRGRDILHNVIGILVFLSIQYVFIKLYFYIRDKDAKIIDQKIGIGDLAFFVCISPLFSPMIFCIVYVLGLIFSLISHIFRRADATETIPLAGYFSIYTLVILILSFITGSVLCDDDRIIQLLNF